MSTRRSFLKGTAAAPLALSPSTATATAAAAGPGVYARLGVRPVINGVGVVTMLGGSIMPPEVVRAMEEASRQFVPLADLQRKAGARIAELLHVPAAMITGGAASSITVATGAAIAGGDPDRLRRLPDTAGMKNEVIQQKTHRSGYEAQITLVGAKVITVETAEQLQNAIGDRTAMLFFLNKADPDGQIRRAEFLRIARQRNVISFNDAASDATPTENLWKYVQEGFDLVAFSGGKALLGPQCSGLLLGRKDLIEAALPCMSPNGGIGRGMKVGKEEMIGLLAAVERYLKVDHQAEMRALEGRVAYLKDSLARVKGLTLKRHVPVIANEVPHLLVSWSEAGPAISSEDVVKKLLEGEPSIAISNAGPRSLQISVWMMRPGEERAVAKRLKEVFA
ncbi:MAG: aminotransferase class V-fold PLP-dependent enzyme [Acidobacteria bacterium]|nr:aminotransferase class V-fold PLP-dependent enzyme [Acidobacteriota bacterium]